jgi:hypothetical protein
MYLNFLGVTRINQRTKELEIKNGFDKITNWFNISEVGRIHVGEYKWRLNFEFGMRTLDERSFRIEVIGLYF